MSSRSRRRLDRGPSLWPRGPVAALLKLAVVEALLLPALGCDPFHTTFEEIEPAVEYEATEKSDPPTEIDRLVVMTWNIKFGGGRIDFFFDCHGDRALMTRQEVLDNLDRLAAKIEEVDPDVVLLQEVDVESKRAAYVDQLQYLLDHTDLNHGVYASQWKADYIPSDGLGRVDSGSAILSRWPLDGGTRIALPLIGEQDALTQYFWLRRNVLTANVELPTHGRIWIANVHTAAFSRDGTKKDHVDGFKEVLDDFDASGKPFVAGGDLNALPPRTVKVKDFPDSVCEGEFEADDYSGEEDWLTPLYDDYEPAIALEDYAEDNTPHFTHTTDGSGFWNRKLDYLFTNVGFAGGQTLQREEIGDLQTMPLSDHAPIVARVRLDR